MQSKHHKVYNMVMFGGPGCGKSTVANYLLDGRDSGRFRTGIDSRAVTTAISVYQKSVAFGGQGDREIGLIDSPGLMDPEMKLEDIAKDISRNIGHTLTFDAACLVSKATDYRLTA